VKYKVTSKGVLQINSMGSSSGGLLVSEIEADHTLVDGGVLYLYDRDGAGQITNKGIFAEWISCVAL